MGKAFFTKKQKARMKERRKKKKLAEQANDDLTSNNTNDNMDAAVGAQDSLDSMEGVDKNSGATTNEVSKKRLRDEAPEDDDVAPPPAKKAPLKLRTRTLDGKLQVGLPSSLSSQEAKKFRKDARRQLRKQQQGKDEDVEIEFVDEHELPKPKTKNFPSIKDLLVQKRHQDQIRKEEEKRQEKINQIPEETKAQYLALDCEMVGVGSDGKKSALARVSMVDWQLNVVFDTFVQVPIRVTDFRTHVSGVEPKHIKRENAMDVAQCREKVATFLKEKILVGHALSNDLKALMLTHPKSNIRDTAKFRPFQRYGNNKWRARKLRDLVKENLQGKYDGFQEGEHDSVHDARATMELFQLVRNQWEKELASKTR